MISINDEAKIITNTAVICWFIIEEVFSVRG